MYYAYVCLLELYTCDCLHVQALLYYMLNGSISSFAMSRASEKFDLSLIPRDSATSMSNFGETQTPCVRA